MSARLAALALVTYDLDVAEAVRVAKEHIGNGTTWVAVEELARYLKGCWTLSLAATAAGSSEERVVAAVLMNFANAGTAAVCRRIARGVFK
jgi:hypothetical protein